MEELKLLLLCGSCYPLDEFECVVFDSDAFLVMYALLMTSWSDEKGDFWLCKVVHVVHSLELMSCGAVLSTLTVVGAVLSK